MLFKSFSRHSSLAKTIFAASNASGQPAFFMTTSQLKRQQSQLVPRQNSSFGSSRNSNNSTNPKAYACLCNSSSYSTLSPLSSLDDDKRREAILNESIGSSGSCLIYNQQHSLAPSNEVLESNYSTINNIRSFSRPRRCSTSVLDEDFTPLVEYSGQEQLQRRRYSTSAARFGSRNNTTSNSPTNENSQPQQPRNDSDTSKPSSTSAAQPSQTNNTFYEPSYENGNDPINESTSTTATKNSNSELNPLTPQNSTSSIASDQFTPNSSSFSEKLSPIISSESSPLLPSLYKNLSNALSSGSFQSVVSSYDLFVKNEIPLDLDSTQAVLQVISQNLTQKSVDPVTAAVSTLEIYSHLISRQVTPSLEIYSTVISTLIESSKFINSTVESSFLFKGITSRVHPKLPLLQSIKSELQNCQSSPFAKIALDIYNASTTYHSKKYSPAVYSKLIDACVTYHHEKYLSSIISSYEEHQYTLSPQDYANLILGYGQYKDASAVIECYNFYKRKAPIFSDKKEMLVYSALVTAFFKLNSPSSALRFLDLLLDSTSSNTSPQSPHLSSIPLYAPKISQTQNDKRLASLAPVVNSIIAGFASIGDYNRCWEWILKVNSNAEFPPIDLSTLITSLTCLCKADQVSLADKLFDLMASRKDSKDSLEFNVARADYLAMCIRTKSFNLFMKAIKESRLRNGIWDTMTIISATRYLIALGEAELATKVFNQQTERYTQYINSNSELCHLISSSNDTVQTDAYSSVTDYMEKYKLLNVANGLNLSKSSFFSKRSFFREKGGQKILQKVWDDVALNNLKELNAIRETSPYIDSYIVSLHLVWIKACAGENNSLGEISLPYPLLDYLKENFAYFVNSLIQRQAKFPLSINSEFISDISEALTLLNDSETKWKWQKFTESLSSPTPIPVDISKAAADLGTTSTSNENSLHPNPSVSQLPWRTDITSQITLLAQNPSTLYKAFDQLEQAVALNQMVGPEAYLAIIDSASSKKALTIIQSAYRLALQSLPHPSEHPDAWVAWNMIHRSVIQRANLDYTLAQAAYQHLAEMGSFPCANGYAQLINNAPSSNSHDEASDAMRLFSEARQNGVILNTFIYNVLLSKLSKARHLKEALELFNDMDATQTKKTNITYGTMISACCRSGEEATALKLFEEMESSPQYTPKIAPFNTLLQYYVHTKQDREKALTVYNKIKTIGLNPSEHTYKLLIECYSAIAPIDIEQADNVLLTIVNDKNQVTTKHYATLIFGRGVSLKNLRAAQDFYNALVNQNRVRPDKHIFQALLESYTVNENQVHGTTDVLKEMVKYGVDLDACMANTLIRGWAKVNLAKAQGLFDYIMFNAQIAEPSSFESIIRAYLYHGQTDKVFELVQLLKAQYYPEPVVSKIEQLVSRYVSNDGMAIVVDIAERERILLESIFRHDSHALLQSFNGSTSSSQMEIPIPHTSFVQQDNNIQA